MPVGFESTQGMGGWGALEIRERRGDCKHALLGVNQSGNHWNVVSGSWGTGNVCMYLAEACLVLSTNLG